MSTPSWYDVLGVEPEADAEEIRSEWRAAIADLDPGHRRFRVLNDAAEVLLDPQRRREHDIELGLVEPDPEPDPVDAEPAPRPTSRLRAKAAPVELFRPAPPDEPAAPEPATGSEAEPAEPVTAEPAAEPAQAGESGESTGWAPPVWLLGGVLVLILVLVGLCIWQASVSTDAAVRAGTRDAQAAAERASVAVLSYDYQDMDGSEATAAEFLTPQYRRDDYEPLFEFLRDNAPTTQTVVSAEVVASGIVRSGDDRVSVLVFVNRPTTRVDQPQPEIYRDQVTMEMTKVDDEWLVDDMVTTALSE